MSNTILRNKILSLSVYKGVRTLRQSLEDTIINNASDEDLIILYSEIIEQGIKARDARIINQRSEINRINDELGACKGSLSIMHPVKKNISTFKTSSTNNDVKHISTHNSLYRWFVAVINRKS